MPRAALPCLAPAGGLFCCKCRSNFNMENVKSESEGVENLFVQLCQTDGKQRECGEYAPCCISVVNCLPNRSCWSRYARAAAAMQLQQQTLFVEVCLFRARGSEQWRGQLCLGSSWVVCAVCWQGGNFAGRERWLTFLLSTAALGLLGVL